MQKVKFGGGAEGSGGGRAPADDRRRTADERNGEHGSWRWTLATSRRTVHVITDEELTALALATDPTSA